MTRYINTAETAKLIRKALATVFPGVKFSVRSKTYSGGSSITVGWTDGPTDEQVSAITRQYQSARFDGSIDLGFSVDHWLLPDGSAVVARSPGSTGSMGYYEPINHPAPAEGAELVSFGSNYVFTHREVSPALMQRALDKVLRSYSAPEAEGVRVTVTPYGSAILSSDPRIEGADQWLSSLVYQECRRRSAGVAL